MKNKTLLIVVGVIWFLVTFCLGFFAGREHLRYQIKSSYQEISESITNRYLEKKNQELDQLKAENEANYGQAMDDYNRLLEEQEESGEYRFWATPPVVLPTEE